MTTSTNNLMNELSQNKESKFAQTLLQRLKNRKALDTEYVEVSKGKKEKCIPAADLNSYIKEGWSQTALSKVSPMNVLKKYNLV